MTVRDWRRYPIPVLTGVGLLAGLGARFVGGAPRTGDALFLSVLLLGGVPLVVQTVRGMLHGRFAADIVAMLAIATAFVLGEYFAGAVIVLMQSGGEALEAFAMRRASNALEALLARAPKVAHREREGRIEDIPVASCRIGDLLVLKPGDLVPVDGTVVSGTSTVDQSALTGEPLPLRAEAGRALLSGSVNLEGVLRMRAHRESEDSQYQQIVRLVQRARLEKPPIQRLADRFAVWFTPVTLVMCGVAYVVTGDFTAVLAVLVVATPCPLILATPIAVIAGISRAADAGIIVKTGAAIERVGQAGALVFDKTGTLTLGHATVARVLPLDQLPADTVLRFAAAVEELSAHHLAQAVAAEGRRRFALLPPASDFQEAPGSGVWGCVEGRAVAVGSARFLGTRGIAVPPTPDDGTTAYVGVDGRLAGAIEFADRLRHQVPGLMQRLAVLGVTETVMLTGDRRTSAEAIAAQAGIHTVRSDLLPADKVAAVADLKRRHGTVVMVGDGINDAPALAAATVGIALGAHGTAVSAEAADIVLLVDDISRVADAMVISRRMRRIALQSIGIGLGTSLVLMGIASAGLIAPPLGALLQEALDAAVILNALRVR